MPDSIEHILRHMKIGATKTLLGRGVHKINDNTFVIDTQPHGSSRQKTGVYTIDGAVGLLTGGVLGDPRYYEPHHLPKWNVEPDLLRVAWHTGGGPLARRVFHELTKEQHASKAIDFAKRAGQERHAYSRALDSAIKRYGDVPLGRRDIKRYGNVPLGRHTSGIYNPDFPETVKDKLRTHLRHINDLTSAA